MIHKTVRTLALALLLVTHYIIIDKYKRDKNGGSLRNERRVLLARGRRQKGEELPRSLDPEDEGRLVESNHCIFLSLRHCKRFSIIRALPRLLPTLSPTSIQVPAAKASPQRKDSPQNKKTRRSHQGVSRLRIFAKSTCSLTTRRRAAEELPRVRRDGSAL